MKNKIEICQDRIQAAIKEKQEKLDKYLLIGASLHTIEQQLEIIHDRLEEIEGDGKEEIEGDGK